MLFIFNLWKIYLSEIFLITNYITTNVKVWLFMCQSNRFANELCNETKECKRMKFY